MPRVFLDANIPLYAAGGPHLLKDRSLDVLELAEQHRSAFCTDAEVFQEMLHRYRPSGLWAEGRALLWQFGILMEGRVEPVQVEDVLAAVELAQQYSGRLSARDLLHLAIMARIGVTHIVTADTGFDHLDGIERLDPARVESWRESIIEGA